jgi:predicted acylesterase/phospholipase RssA
MQRLAYSSHSPDQPRSAGGELPGQIVLVLQGGGALGSYQAGVYQALHEAGIAPDWIIGTSIGAINAGLIAGNEPQCRLERLHEFWRRVQRVPHWSFRGPFPGFGERWLTYWTTLTQGIPGFFTPNPLAHAGDAFPLGADRAGYYSTAPLEQTLAELVNFDLINRGRLRLTVGAAHVRTSQMRYFDTREGKIDVRHIMASGALPPAFPPLRIDCELYWDGGILSNTPTEAVFDDNPRRDSVIFSVHLWNPVCENERAALSKGISIHSVSSDATVLSDGLLLGAALRNLVSNAVKYTKLGGRVLLGCRRSGSEKFGSTCTIRALESPTSKYRESSKRSLGLTPHSARASASVSSSCGRRSEFWGIASTSPPVPVAGLAFPFSSNDPRRERTKPDTAQRETGSTREEVS